ncbi:MAG: HAD-IIIA family hydrolase [Pseudomonadota bacterium]
MPGERNRVRLVVFDVDGVFTDGRITYDEDGRESKTFHTQDGFGIRRLQQTGCKIAVITGRRSGAVAARMQELGVQHVFQGCRDKLPVLEALLQELAIAASESAFVGDDVPDLPPMQHVGTAIAVANAVPEVLAMADKVTDKRGGHGAVREVCDWLMGAETEAL